MNSFFQDSLYEKVYGTSAIGHRQSNALIIENPNLEKLVDGDIKPEINNASIDEKPKSTSTPVKTPLPVNNKQVETRTSDGRRRITPICVAPAPDIGFVCTARDIITI